MCVPMPKGLPCICVSAKDSCGFKCKCPGWDFLKAAKLQLPACLQLEAA